MSEAMVAYLEAGRPPICPRCGNWDGPTLPDCTVEGFTHQETCSKFTYDDDLCDRCEGVLSSGPLY